MKKNIIIILAFILSNLSFGQEKCVQGDCEAGFGISENSDKSIITTGFFYEGKLNGAGFKKEKNGHYMFSNFKNGIPTGNSVYYIGEGSRQHGIFEKGLKEGIHILIDDAIFTESIQIAYKNDKEISRKKFTFDTSKANQGCQGDCENGYGVKTDPAGNIIIGFFENSIFYRGEVINAKDNSCNIYNKNDKEIKLGMYRIMNNNGTLIESIEVMNYSELLKIQNSINKITIIRDSHRILGTEYLPNNEVKETFKNF